MYKKFNQYEVIGYSDSNFVGCLLHHPQWKQNLWYVLKPQLMHYGCEMHYFRTLDCRHQVAKTLL